MILDIPYLKVLIDKRVLTGSEESGFINAYLFSVTLIESRPLLFTAHLEDGAIYSRIPLKYIFHKEPEGERLLTDPWGAISSNGQVVQHRYLKDYFVECDISGFAVAGRYLFTIDYFDGGFSEDPEQHKTSNIISLETGQLAALPNNLCRFVDDHFTESGDLLKYKRNSVYWTF